MSGIKVFIETRIELDDGRGSILKICKNNNILITKINRVDRGFKLSIETSREAEKIFEAGIRPVFEHAGLIPKLPPSLKCERTLLLRNPDEFILSQTTDEIIREINTRNRNSGINVVDAFRIPKSSIIKLEFTTAEMSNTVLNRGLNMFYLHQPGRKFEQDVLIYINYCDNCQEMESHATENCPENRITCPKCSKKGHKDCNIDPSNFRCIHCNQNHHSRFIKCPERIKKLAEKRRNLRRPKTYSQITNKSPPNSMNEPIPSRAFSHPVRQPLLPTPSLTPALNVNSDANSHDKGQNTIISDQVDTAKTNSKIFTVLQFALLKEMQCPGSFQGVYKKLCQKNDLPEINLDEYEPPNLETIQKVMSGQKPDRVTTQIMDDYALPSPTKDESLFMSTHEGNSYQSPVDGADEMTMVSSPMNTDATSETEKAEKLPEAPEKIAPQGNAAEKIATLGTGAGSKTAAVATSTLDIPCPLPTHPHCSTPKDTNKKIPPKIEVIGMIGSKIGSTSRQRVSAFKGNKIMIKDQHGSYINDVEKAREILGDEDLNITLIAREDFTSRLAQYLKL